MSTETFRTSDNIRWLITHIMSYQRWWHGCRMRVRGRWSNFIEPAKIQNTCNIFGTRGPVICIGFLILLSALIAEENVLPLTINEFGINLFTPFGWIGFSQRPLSWSYQFLSGVTCVYSVSNCFLAVSKTLGKPGKYFIYAIMWSIPLTALIFMEIRTVERHQAGSPYIKFKQDLSSKNYGYKFI